MPFRVATLGCSRQLCSTPIPGIGRRSCGTTQIYPQTKAPELQLKFFIERCKMSGDDPFRTLRGFGAYLPQCSRPP